MKNISIAIFTVLAATAILFSSCDNSSKTGNNGGQGADSTKMEAGNGSIAYVRIDSLVNNYDMYHDLKAEYEKKVKQMDAEFTAKGRSFQKEVADFQEKAQKGLITNSQGEQIQRQLEQRQADLQKTREKMQTELMEQEAVMMRQIQESVTSYINKYNQTKRFSLIISTSASNVVVLYGDKNMDITSDIIKGLNEDYIQNRPAPTSTETTK